MRKELSVLKTYMGEPPKAVATELATPPFEVE